jgi:signal transduction histidine kinase
MVLVVCALLATVAGIAAQILLPAQGQLMTTLVGVIPLTLVALWFTARRAARPGPEAGGWMAIAAFLCIALFIQVLRVCSVHGFPLNAAARQAFRLLPLLGSCLQVWALVSWPDAPRSRFDRIRHGLDGLVFALAVLFVLWGLVLGPLFLSDRFPLGDRLLWLTTFLIYDLLLGVTVYLGLAQPNRFRGPLGWLAGAFLLACLFNFEALMGKLAGTPFFNLPTGSNFVIPLAYLGAALSPRPVGATALPIQGNRFIHAVPYIPVLGALVLGLWLLVTGSTAGRDPVLLWLAFALLGILLVRQYLALRDFSVLSQHLETRVTQRTEALEKAQELLLRTERLNTMATLGAGLAHDLNNLLSAIHSRAELLLLDLDEGRLPNRRDLIRVQEATQHAASLSGRLMAMGRRDPEPPWAMDLVAELHAIQPLLQLLLPRNQTLRLECEPAGAHFLGTRGMLEQVLVNLVSNARDAMPDGGTITIRARGPLPEEPTLGPLLEIADTGSGIAVEAQEHVFEPFFTTKASGTGTGLGLVSVKSMLEAAGGSIQFATRIGQGTTFLIRLPREA